VKYRVVSRRLAWPYGSVITAADAGAGNIHMLVATGHLAPEAPAPSPKKRSTEPEPPVTTDDSADEPEEQD
jgi:hypothetical protein